jgi:hypothetical protein
VINRIACPDCRMLGQVDKIVTNQERQEVA